MSSAVEDYTKAIFHLERQLEGPVSTNALADRLAVRPASASGMLKKLDDLGYLTYVPYHGFTLSDQGRRAALTVIRRHRLLELFLYDVLGVTWDKVHDEAEALEHALSPELCDLIAARLGDPTVDPHGDPIPTRDGELLEPRFARLSALAPGERARVSRVSDRDPEVLRELSRLGIGLGEIVTVVVHGERGTTVTVGAVDRVLSPTVLAAVLVEPVS